MNLLQFLHHKRETTFDEIVNGISFEEFKKTLLQSWLPEKALAKRTNSDVLLNISYVAKAIARMHPAWDKWDEDPKSRRMKERFIKAIENLYNTQAATDERQRLKGGSIARELYKAVGLLNDNHLEVFYGKDKEGNLALPVMPEERKKYRPDPKGSVGKNVAYQYTHSDANTYRFRLKMGDDYRPIVFARRKINGKETAIIGLTTCWIHHGTPMQHLEEENFQKVVDVFKENLDAVDNIIIDVRGNGGGITEYLEKIAKVIYGEEPALCAECGHRTTDEENLWEHHVNVRWPKSGPKKQYTGKQKLFVLMDGETASSAESVHPLFEQYAGTQFIGEKTMGCCQYTSCGHIALPCGGTLHMGHVFCGFWDGPVEGVGFRPGINCSGRDAFEVACEQIGAQNTMHHTLSTGAHEGSAKPCAKPGCFSKRDVHSDEH